MASIVFYKDHYSTNSLKWKQIDALKEHQGSFEAQMQFSELAKSVIRWWAEKSSQYAKKMSHSNPRFTLKTDASLEC